MKNVIISICIFIVMLIAIFFSLNYLTKTCDNLMTQCDELEDIISKETWDNSYEKSMDLLEDLQDKHNILSMFIHHQEIDNMTNELYKFTQYVKGKNKDEALASIHVVKFYIEHIEDLQKVTIQNIF